MPRVARIVIPGLPHHITQRGNNHQGVFFVDPDRIKYLELSRSQSARYGMRIEGYCLMTNHVHLIARPEHEESLAKGLDWKAFLTEDEEEHTQAIDLAASRGRPLVSDRSIE